MLGFDSEGAMAGLYMGLADLDRQLAVSAQDVAEELAEMGCDASLCLAPNVVVDVARRFPLPAPVTIQAAASTGRFE
jgi:hypothetical protein